MSGIEIGFGGCSPMWPEQFMTCIDFEELLETPGNRSGGLGRGTNGDCYCSVDTHPLICAMPSTCLMASFNDKYGSSSYYLFPIIRRERTITRTRDDDTRHTDKIYQPQCSLLQGQADEEACPSNCIYFVTRQIQSQVKQKCKTNMSIPFWRN